MSATAMLPFSLDGRELLVDASFVREILGEVVSILVPQADREVPGVFLWNGQAVPLLDLNHCMGFTVKPDAANMPRTIVGKIHGELVGFSVAELGEVVFVSMMDLTAPRVHELPFALAEVVREHGVSTVLDLSKLVEHVMHIKAAP